MEKDIIGNVYENKLNQKFKVIKFDKVYNKNSYFIIEFIKTGYRASVTRYQIKNKCIKDHLEPSVANIGYIGITEYNTRSREYSVWHNMINRCYNPKSTEYIRYGAKGVYVCERWHCFANFVNDIKLLPGYDEELFYSGKIQLDKDILCDLYAIQKHYSPETCQFILNNDNTRYAKSIPIIGIDLNSNELYFSNSIADFAKMRNIVPSEISNTLNGRQNSCHNYKFYYRPAYIIPATIIDKV